MKRLYIVGGTMGVGKTTACREMQKKLDRCVFLDGDNCWDMKPFVVTEETKQMVMNNICFMLQSFIDCTEYENIIFCWVLHEQAIIDEIISRLSVKDYDIVTVSLLCGRTVLAERLQKDVAAGKRTADVIERSVKRIPLYENLNTEKIYTDALTPEKTAEAIINI